MNYNKSHKKEQREQNRKWNKKNKKKINAVARQKRKTNIRYKLNANMATAIWKVLKKNKGGRAWVSLVGYTVDELKKYLKKTMPKGYVWQDYLDGKLHVDHKIPRSVFNFTKPEHRDFKRCWALRNLQLLPAKKNMSTGATLTKHFQPSLLI